MVGHVSGCLHHRQLAGSGKMAQIVAGIFVFAHQFYSVYLSVGLV